MGIKHNCFPVVSSDGLSHTVEVDFIVKKGRLQETVSSECENQVFLPALTQLTLHFHH